MRIKDLNEGFSSGFKSGYGKEIARPKQKSVPAGFDNHEVKKILAAVIDGKQLDSFQLDTLKQLYKRL